MTAVELGAEIAAYDRARIHTAAFEDWPLVAESFDLVVVATAFH